MRALVQFSGELRFLLLFLHRSDVQHKIIVPGKSAKTDALLTEGKGYAYRNVG